MKQILSLLLFMPCLFLKGQFSENVLVSRSEDIAYLRNEISDYVYGNETIPEFTMDISVNKYMGVISRIYSSGNLGEVEVGTVTMKHGFTSKISFFHPVRSNGLKIPIIYHTGHGYGVLQEDLYVNNNDHSDEYHIKVIDFFLSRGFDIIGIDMPFFGANKFPAQVSENYMSLRMYGHNDLFNLEHPFYYFMAPVRSVLDYLQKEKDYNEFVMLGLSGGGWTTTLYSAMDTRIRLSFPVAGSIPIPLRTESRDIGDLEQTYPDFYSMFNYSTLYYLGASGKGRRQFQVLIQNDNCCFAFNGKDYWVDSIKNKLRIQKDPGSFDFYFDTLSLSHKISTIAVDSIYNNIIRYMGNERLKLLNKLSSSKPDVSICDNDTLSLSVPGESTNEITWYRNKVKEDNHTAYNYIVNKPGKYFASVKNLSGAVINTDTIQIDQLLVFSKPLITWKNGILSSSYADKNQWFRNGKLLVNESGKQINGQLPGRYTVKVISGNCSSELSDPYDVGLLLYPNPASSYLNVRLQPEYGNVQYGIYEVSGLLISSGQFRGEKNLLIPAGITSGWYYLKLIGSGKLNTVIKFRVK